MVDAEFPLILLKLVSLLAMKFCTILTVVAAAASANAFTFAAWYINGYTPTAFFTTCKGTHKLAFTAKSYKWASNKGDKCCIKFCKENTEMGYRGPAYNNDHVSSEYQFNKVVTGCGSTILNC
ncbi:hypothetical protein BJ165DRAFT_651339 [Panaeolus papilionaceus]|nr:hypothetical protein BJ165DRAFT_651339 [Panaeolus papilionaceus]